MIEMHKITKYMLKLMIMKIDLNLKKKIKQINYQIKLPINKSYSNYNYSYKISKVQVCKQMTILGKSILINYNE